MGEHIRGEVRIKAKLINAVDEASVRRAMLRSDEVRAYEADALIDTGAARPVIPSHVVQQPGLAERGKRVAEYADGRKDAVGVTEALIVEINGRDTL